MKTYFDNRFSMAVMHYGGPKEIKEASPYFTIKNKLR
jgi:hypothetical protein